MSENILHCAKAMQARYFVISDCFFVRSNVRQRSSSSFTWDAPHHKEMLKYVRPFSSESATSDRRCRKVYMDDDAICFFWEVDDTYQSHKAVASKQQGKLYDQPPPRRTRNRSGHDEVFMSARRPARCCSTSALGLAEFSELQNCGSREASYSLWLMMRFGYTT
jgi:hypothetical protein